MGQLCDFSVLSSPYWENEVVLLGFGGDWSEIMSTNAGSALSRGATNVAPVITATTIAVVVVYVLWVPRVCGRHCSCLRVVQVFPAALTLWPHDRHRPRRTLAKETFAGRPGCAPHARIRGPDPGKTCSLLPRSIWATRG